MPYWFYWVDLDGTSTRIHGDKYYKITTLVYLIIKSGRAKYDIEVYKNQHLCMKYKIPTKPKAKEETRSSVN